MSRAALIVVLICSAAAQAAPARLLVSIGSDIGDPEDPPLRFAAEDARRVAQIFIELGSVTPNHAFVLSNVSAAAVRERLVEVSGRIAELNASNQEVELIIYASGHASKGTLHLAGTHLPLATLRELAADTHARLRVLIIDACDSGAIARQKGGRPGKGYDVSLERLPLAGEVVMTSSGSTEASEEWDSLGGSLFTHHLLAGLRGDADAENDGKVTLSEVYSYAYRRTLAGSATVQQHPGVDLDLTGAGELVLTEPATARSALVFPADSAGHYVISSQPRSDIVVEIEKRPGVVLQLAVPEGRYLVRKRRGQSTGLLSVELPYGGKATITESDLVWRNFAEVALKGGDVELKPRAVMLGGSVVTEPIEKSGPRWRVDLGYRHTFGSWWVTGRLSGSHATFGAVGVTTTESSGAVGLSGGYRWVWATLIPYVGVGCELLFLRQSYVRDDEVELQRVFGTALPSRNALGFSGGPVLAVEVPLPARFFALGQVHGLMRYLPAEGQPPLGFGLTATIALGVRF